MNELEMRDVKSSSSFTTWNVKRKLNFFFFYICAQMWKIPRITFTSSVYSVYANMYERCCVIYVFIPARQQAGGKWEKKTFMGLNKILLMCNRRHRAIKLHLFVAWVGITLGRKTDLQALPFCPLHLLPFSLPCHDAREILVHKPPRHKAALCLRYPRYNNTVLLLLLLSSCRRVIRAKCSFLRPRQHPKFWHQLSILQTRESRKVFLFRSLSLSSSRVRFFSFLFSHHPFIVERLQIWHYNVLKLFDFIRN